MAHRSMAGLRLTLFAALGVSAAWGCGDDDGDDTQPSAGASGSKPTAGTGGNPSGGTAHFGGMAGRSGSGGVGGVSGSAGTAGAQGGDAGGGIGGSHSGGSSGDSGSGGTIDMPARFECRNPRPFAEGFVECAGGWLHRPEQRECPIRLDQAGGAGGAGAGGGPFSSEDECRDDTDCTDRPYGHCGRLEGDFPQPGLVCIYGCRVDSDCSGTQICLCGPKTGACVPASCATDADCGDFLCTSSQDLDVCGAPDYRFACQSRSDHCITASDCPDSGVGGYGTVDCVPTSSGRRCEENDFVCGRPFLVTGEARQATACISSDWVVGRAPQGADLDVRARRELADHWTRMALLEHASVAAFARFTLELLSLGAPAELLARTHAALGDEIAHAEACFSLASAYAGHPVGPGPLAIRDALPADSSWLDVVRGAFLEACIGETIAAAEAAEALAFAKDAAARDVLARIAADEAQHAELGWRFLRWALENADPALRSSTCAALETLLERELSHGASTDPQQPESDLSAHGLLPRSVQRAIRHAALREVVVPCARALGILEQRRAA